MALWLEPAQTLCLKGMWDHHPLILYFRFPHSSFEMCAWVPHHFSLKNKFSLNKKHNCERTD